MRRSDFWERLNAVLGPAYAASWAHDVVLPDLGVTVDQAFAGGEEAAVIWKAVCRVIDVPSFLR